MSTKKKGKKRHFFSHASSKKRTLICGRGHAAADSPTFFPAKVLSIPFVSLWKELNFHSDVNSMHSARRTVHSAQCTAHSAKLALWIFHTATARDFFLLLQVILAPRCLIFSSAFRANHELYSAVIFCSAPVTHPVYIYSIHWQTDKLRFSYLNISLYYWTNTGAAIAQSVQRLPTGWTVRESNPCGGLDFPHLSRPALISTQPPIHWVPGLNPG